MASAVTFDGTPVDWSARVHGGERIAVYPVFESLDEGPTQRLRPEPLRRTSFVAPPSSWTRTLARSRADHRVVLTRVPPNSRDAFARFLRCASCGAVYWRGTHYAELEAKVTKILARARSDRRAHGG